MKDIGLAVLALIVSVLAGGVTILRLLLQI